MSNMKEVYSTQEVSAVYAFKILPLDALGKLECNP